MYNRFFDIEGDLSIQVAPWKLRENEENKAIFVLKEDLWFRSDIAGGIIVVKAGFRSDLASIPRLAWSIFMSPVNPKIALGSWVHDYLYDKEGNQIPIYKTLGALTPIKTVNLTRKDADAILAHEAMPELGASSWQCTVVYQAVRRFGPQWKKNPFSERFE